MISYKQLEEFGLSEKEARIYLAALGLGADTAQNIAKKSGIHRVSAYDILEALTRKGFIRDILKGKKRLFVAIGPEKIMDSLKAKETVFNSLLPELKALQSKGKARPKVMYFEGRDEVWEAYQDRILHKPELKENLVYGSSELLLETFPEGFKKFTQERLAKGIKSRIIVERSASGLKEAKHAKNEMREVKFLPKGISFKANTIIYGDRVMTVSWDSMFLVITEDKNNTDNQRVIFDILWKYLP